MEAEAVRVEAAAKVNLSLRVKAADSGGLHPVLSLVQSIDRRDRLRVAPAPEDALAIEGADLSSDRDNLIWKAVDAVRAETGNVAALRFELSKRIPVAAGLAGGSADAAATLAAVGRLLRLPEATLQQVATRVGADVPFCLVGGFAWMEGHGERLTPIDGIPDDYALAVVVPPFELDTGSVYRRWDRLGEPGGDPVEGKHLPPSLRPYAPLTNDLYPAALHLQADLGDWRAELVDRWERPVMLSGSGPSLFGYFTGPDEAAGAVAAAPPDARSCFVASPVSYGARITEE